MYKVIIPVRYASTRLPGKPLLDIAGKPLFQHAYEAACASQAEQVLIATDDQRIADIAASINANVIITSAQHTSGTDRLAEVVTLSNELDDTVIVNLQGDEVGMPAALIDQVAMLLIKHVDAKMATLCEVINNGNDINDINIVKVVFDKNNTALYFSRLPIPWQQTGQEGKYFRHIGLYAYRAGYLKEFSHRQACALEKSESLEQLRALYYGDKIYVEEACEASGMGIDTEADLERARELFV